MLAQVSLQLFFLNNSLLIYKYINGQFILIADDSFGMSILLTYFAWIVKGIR